MKKPGNTHVVKFRESDPLQDYYILTSSDKTEYWSVARLIDAAKDLEPFDIPLAGIDLDSEIWKGCNIYALAYHVKRVNDADLSKPIILDWNGVIADGRHRLIKALVQGKRTIKAVRITWELTPCRTN
jgi:hypothetical protein